jgi:hypothetical protein
MELFPLSCYGGSITAMVDSLAVLSQHAVWAPLVAATAIAGGSAKGFAWFDAALNDDSRFKLSMWLVDVPGDEQIDAWASVFPNLIDSIFGPKALSWKFFFRSCIASILAIVILTSSMLLLEGSSWFENEEYFKAVLTFELIAAFIVNLVPDYFSIVISRFIVSVPISPLDMAEE